MGLGLFTIEGTWTGHITEKEARGVISIKKQNLHSVNKNCKTVEKVISPLSQQHLSKN